MKLAMMDTLKVEDVMTLDVVTLSTNEPVEVAWLRMRKAGISGAPVLDTSGRVVGVLSYKDLADPRHHDPEAVVTVEALMTRVVYAVRPRDSLATAVRLMREEKIHRVVVVSAKGELRGIVVPMDILRALPLEEGPHVSYVDLRGMHRTG